MITALIFLNMISHLSYNSYLEMPSDVEFALNFSVVINANKILERIKVQKGEV